MFIDSSLARSLAKKHLAEWSAQGAALSEKFLQIVRTAFKTVENGTSPSKAINRIECELKKFFSQISVSGSIVETHSRKLEFSLTYPESTQDGLAFVVISGHFNGRTGTRDVHVTRPLLITLHALERLHQRIGVIEPTEVLSEIYGAVSNCATITEAARQVGARSCPLLSKHGIFVTAPTIDSSMSTLVTWMPCDQLSRKWGAVADALREISEHRPALQDDCEFLVEFLKSFRWMLKPHQPGIDKEAIAWGQAIAKPIFPSDPNPPVISEKYLQAIETDLSLPADQELQSPVEVEIEDLVTAEVNSFSTLPPFKVFDRFLGLVVRRTQSGYVIVSLLNGWFGAIPAIGLDRANSVVDGLGNLKIGDRVSVQVRKLYQSDSENTWGVSLDLTEKVDTEWNLAAAKYPPGTVVDGVVFRTLDHGYLLRLTDGVSALLLEKELSWSGPPHNEDSIPKLGQKLSIKVTGVNRSKKLLIASRRQFTENPFKGSEATEAEWQRILASYPEGTIVQGRISDIWEWGASVLLSDGAIGFLHVKEFSWTGSEADARKTTLAKGQLLEMKVIGIKPAKQLLTLSRRQCTLHPLDDPELCPIVGNRYSGVVSNVADYGAFIKLPCGVEGLLHRSELPENWKFESDQIVEVVVKSIDHEQRRVALALGLRNSNLR